MSDTAEVPTVPAEKTAKPRKAQPEAPAAVETPESAAPQQFAKIRTLRKGVKACGFTFGKKKIVPKVPLEHAEFLKKNAEVEILEVFSA